MRLFSKERPQEENKIITDHCTRDLYLASRLPWQLLAVYPHACKQLLHGLITGKQTDLRHATCARCVIQREYWEASRVYMYDAT